MTAQSSTHETHEMHEIDETHHQSRRIDRADTGARHEANLVGYLLLLCVFCGLCVPTSAQTRTPIPVWIDTDPAVGVPDRDVDDGFALVQAFNSPEIAIRGVSVVFGNAPLAQAWPIGRRIVQRFGPRGLRAHRGAASASELGVETAASRALAAALRAEPLVVLVLGPATNVATVLKNHPELAPRVTRLVAVAGRRPGQRFTTGTTNPAGHRDFNFELDPPAIQVLLDARVPVTLTPFEISSRIWMTAEDLATLSRGSAAVTSMLPAAHGWLGLWKRTFGVDGFNPFDTLAVARIVSPALMTCERLPARIEERADDVTEPRMQGANVARKPYLLAAAELAPATVVEYCGTAAPAFKSDLLRRLAGK
jgi:pyrimidine-specific ribonucleoside hydrolase